MAAIRTTSADSGNLHLLAISYTELLILYVCGRILPHSPKYKVCGSVYFRSIKPGLLHFALQAMDRLRGTKGL
jgi:hypothetical protein